MESEQKFTKTTEFIMQVVADSYDVPVSVMSQKKGKGHEVEARKMAMYMMRKFLPITYYQILECFPAIENHTTVIYSLRSIEDIISYDKKVSSLAFSIIAKVSAFVEADKKRKRLSHYTIYDGECAFGMYPTEESAKIHAEIGRRVVPVYV